MQISNTWAKTWNVNQRQDPGDWQMAQQDTYPPKGGCFYWMLDYFWNEALQSARRMNRQANVSRSTGFHSMSSGGVV